MQLIIWGIIAIFAVVSDFISKRIVLDKLVPIGSAEFIPGIINFQYVENTGAAFGMMKDCRWLFIVVSSLAIVAICVYLIVFRKKIHPLLGIGLAMVMGGGIGNQIDRIALGYVVDFIHFDFYFPVLEDFPTFNIADSFVTVGAILIIVAEIFFDKELRKSKTEPSEIKNAEGNDSNVGNDSLGK